LRVASGKEAMRPDDADGFVTGWTDTVPNGYCAGRRIFAGKIRTSLALRLARRVVAI
jgi:hypothetical protein